MIVDIAVATHESQRFPGKNSLIINHRPIIAYTEDHIQWLKSIKLKNEIRHSYLISSEEYVLRNANLDVWDYILPDLPALWHQELCHAALKYGPPDAVLILQVNCPLRPKDCLKRLVNAWSPTAARKYDGAVLISRVEHLFGQDGSTGYIDTGAGHIFNYDALLLDEPKLKAVEIPQGSTVDIDYPWQILSLSERLPF